MNCPSCDQEIEWDSKRSVALDAIEKELMVDRLWSRVRFDFDHWLWTGPVHEDGYGRFCWRNRRRPVNRVVYEMEVGAIPPGRWVYVVAACGIRACIYPPHLEAIPRREALRRGKGFPGRQSHQTHCTHGHLFDAANTYVERGTHRRCRTCARLRQQARRDRRRLVNQ